MPETPSPLDNPVWHALTGPQAGLGFGDARARRFHPDIAPFGGVPEPAAADLSVLLDVTAPGAGIAIVATLPIAVPAGLDVVRAVLVDQMAAEAVPEVASADTPVVLGAADVPDMLALVELTNPGPFATRTIETGRYLGIRRDGRLAAMAGERMHLNGFAEVSAVCTHPDFRGRGLAQALVSRVARTVLARGEQPFLHSFPDNQPAIATYTRLGFVRRRVMHFTVMRRPASAA